MLFVIEGSKINFWQSDYLIWRVNNKLFWFVDLYIYDNLGTFAPVQKNILFQGDSWSEQLTLLEDTDTEYLKSRNFVKNLTKKK